jgi:patatin-like phospholipase/acyl hydrolase
VVIVEELEAALGWPVAETFDLVAGTSIGGCGALSVV